VHHTRVWRGLDGGGFRLWTDVLPSHSDNSLVVEFVGEDDHYDTLPTHNSELSVRRTENFLFSARPT